MASVNEILAVAVLITELQAGNAVGTATGFFYSRDDEVYLVTNRHVVREESRNHRPDQLRLRLHTDLNDLSKNADWEVPLYDGQTARWTVHPKYPIPLIDIALVRLDQQVLKKSYVFKALTASNFLPEHFVIVPGEDVMALGFPRGLSDTVHNLPIVRQAMISSAYGVDFRGQPFFLIDGNLHPGMSGSPVITRPKNTWLDKQGNTNMLTGTPMYFLGVHSATLSLSLPSGQEALGLGTVWYGYLIDEIIDALNKKPKAG